MQPSFTRRKAIRPILDVRPAPYLIDIKKSDRLVACCASRKGSANSVVALFCISP